MNGIEGSEMEQDVTTADADGHEMNVEEWLAIRREAGKRIDPESAEVMWSWKLTMDPYGIYSDLTEEEHQIGREYFARAPESEIWVSLGDIPNETIDRLRSRPCPDVLDDNLPF